MYWNCKLLHLNVPRLSKQNNQILLAFNIQKTKVLKVFGTCAMSRSVKEIAERAPNMSQVCTASLQVCQQQ